MNPPDFFDWGRWFGWLVLEGVVVAGLAWGTALFAGTATARRRVWQVALAALGLMAMVEWAGLRTAFSWRPERAREASREIRVTVSAPQTPESGEEMTLPALPVQEPPGTSQSERPVVWPVWLWLAGVVLFLGRMVCRRGVLAWMEWRSTAADAATTVAVAEILPSLPLGRVRLRVWRPLRGPIAYGILRPTVAVPADFADRFDPAARSTMLAHELAHLAGRDPLWLWVSNLVCALWWWHPGVWWARRRLRACSEEVADGASVLAPGGPGVLADCLVQLAREMAPPGALHDMGVRGSGRASDLARRVEALLRTPVPWKPPGRWDSGRSGGIALIVALALCGLPVSWVPGTPLISALAAQPPAPVAGASPSAPSLTPLAPPPAAPPASVAETAGIETNPFPAVAGLPFELTNRSSTFIRTLGQASRGSQATYVRLRDATPEELAAQAAPQRRNENSADEGLKTRSFTVNSQRFTAAIRAAEGVPVSADLQAQVWNFFRSCGLSLDPERPAGTPAQDKPAVFFDEAKGRLLVRASMRELETVERALQLLDAGAAANEPSEPVVTLTSYFAEITVGGPEDIGLDWVFGQAPTNNPTIETFRLESGSGHTDRLRVVGQAATLTPSQFAALHDQMIHRPGLDLLTAPKVTTYAGKQAQVVVKDVRSIVTGVSAQVNDSVRAEGFDRVEKVGGTNAPGVAYLVEQMEFGPELQVVPEVDGSGWQLQLTASLEEFLGYEDPGKRQAKLQVLDAKPLTAQLPLPRLRSRQMTARARIESGGVVALRGPMVEDRTIKKGGLFRRDVTNVVQKRLYVFVKAETGPGDAPAATPDANLRVQPVILRMSSGSAGYEVGQRTVADFELSGVLRSMALAHPGLRLLIRADKDVDYRRVVRVLDAAKEAKIQAVQLTGP